MDFGQLLESVIPFAERLPVIRAVLGSLLVFFVPGFAWTLVFFNRINIIERLALAVGLSIALVILGVFIFNVLFGLAISGTNALVTIIAITVIALVIYWLKRFVPGQPAGGDGD